MTTEFEESEGMQIMRDIFAGNSTETHYVLAVAALKDIQRAREGRGSQGYDSVAELADCVWALSQGVCGMLRSELDHAAELRVSKKVAPDYDPRFEEDDRP